MTRNDDYGEMIEDRTIRFRRLLPGPIEEVWAYLTESDKRGRWLASGPMDLKPGGAVEFHFDHSQLSEESAAPPEKYEHAEGSVMQGRITRCEPPHVLAYTWAEDWGGDSEVTFELEEQGDDVLLTLTHRRLGDDRDVRIGIAAGWHTHLGILVDVMDGRAPSAFWPVHARMEAEYARRLDH